MGNRISRNLTNGKGVVMALMLLAATNAPSQSVITEKTLAADAAFTIARGAMDACRASGSHVSVAVLGGDGLLRAFLRDDQADPHTIELSQRKAYTAYTYRRTSGEQARYWASLPPPPFTVAGTVGLPGGIPIWSGNERIGAVGVSGSAEPPPGSDSGVVTGNADEKCAAAGISKLAPTLK